MLISTLDACIAHLKGDPLEEGYSVSTVLDTSPCFHDTSIISKTKLIFEVRRGQLIESRFWICCGVSTSTRKFIFLLVRRFMLEQHGTVSVTIGKCLKRLFLLYTCP